MIKVSLEEAEVLKAVEVFEQVDSSFWQ